jgi:hypothetical protein
MAAPAQPLAALDLSKLIVPHGFVLSFVARARGVQIYPSPDPPGKPWTAAMSLGPPSRAPHPTPIPFHGCFFLPNLAARPTGSCRRSSLFSACIPRAARLLRRIPLAPRKFRCFTKRNPTSTSPAAGRINKGCNPQTGRCADIALTNRADARHPGPCRGRPHSRSVPHNPLPRPHIQNDRV